MAKAYELHESAYRRLRRENKRYWADLPQQTSPPLVKGVDTNDERFFIDVLDQDWAPKGGRYLELGCGTGPITRWFRQKGYQATGVDISGTAIEMAREQSKGLNIAFRRGDVVSGPLGRRGTYSLIVDGRCLHCLTAQEDRAGLLRRVHALLKPGGVFIALSMCGPVDRTVFSRLYTDQKVLGSTIYAKCDKASCYPGGRLIRGSGYVPIRYVPHWQRLLDELRQASMFPQLIRLHHGFGDEIGFLYAACVPI